MMLYLCRFFVLALVVAPCVAGAQATSHSSSLPGVYRLIEDPKELPSGVKNTGSPLEVPLTPKGLEQQKKAKLKDDSVKLCLPAGPFRMMAWKGNVIDLYDSGDRITMLFQDLYEGHMRTIYTDRREHPKMDPMWEGDSLGHWEGGDLVVETNNFNEFVWLNERGAPHGPAFTMTERYHPFSNGKYLRVAVTATDPEMLQKPYTYVRYYARTNAEVQERVCWSDTKPLGQTVLPQ